MSFNRNIYRWLPCLSVKHVFLGLITSLFLSLKLLFSFRHKLISKSWKRQISLQHIKHPWKSFSLSDGTVCLQMEDPSTCPLPQKKSKKIKQLHCKMKTICSFTFNIRSFLSSTKLSKVLVVFPRKWPCVKLHADILLYIINSVIPINIVYLLYLE